MFIVSKISYQFLCEAGGTDYHLKNGSGSINAAADCSGSNTGEEDLPNSDKFIFLYEDFEGDRMLVGDVPWE